MHLPLSDNLEMLYCTSINTRETLTLLSPSFLLLEEYRVSELKFVGDEGEKEERGRRRADVCVSVCVLHRYENN